MDLAGAYPQKEFLARTPIREVENEASGRKGSCRVVTIYYSGGIARSGSPFRLWFRTLGMGVVAVLDSKRVTHGSTYYIWHRKWDCFWQSHSFAECLFNLIFKWNPFWFGRAVSDDEYTEIWQRAINDRKNPR